MATVPPLRSRGLLIQQPNGAPRSDFYDGRLVLMAGWDDRNSISATAGDIKLIIDSLGTRSEKISKLLFDVVVRGTNAKEGRLEIRQGIHRVGSGVDHLSATLTGTNFVGFPILHIHVNATKDVTGYSCETTRYEDAASSS